MEGTLGTPRPMTASENFISEKQRQREDLNDIFSRLSNIHYKLTGNTGMETQISDKCPNERIKCLGSDFESDILGTDYLISGMRELLSGIESFV